MVPYCHEDSYCQKWLNFFVLVRTYSGIVCARRTRIIPFKELNQTIHQIVRITFEKNFVCPVNLIILVLVIS
jgi:hypothetical protein